jgi:hypothetical protein
MKLFACLLVAVAMALASGEGLRESYSSNAMETTVQANALSTTYECRTSADVAYDDIPTLSEYADSVGNAADAAKDYYCKHKYGEDLLDSLEAASVNCTSWMDRGWFVNTHVEPIAEAMENAGCPTDRDWWVIPLDFSSWWWVWLILAAGILLALGCVIGCVCFVRRTRRRKRATELTVSNRELSGDVLGFGTDEAGNGVPPVILPPL